MQEIRKLGLGSKKRSLTPTIQTRTHRAPEVILTEKSYNEKIDIWGAGIVLAELLNAITKGKYEGKMSNKDQYLFLGQSCYPISPNIEKKNMVDKNDQIFKIL